MERQLSPGVPASQERSALQLVFTDDALAPLVERIVRQVIEGQQGRLAYPEAEAAELLGVPSHVLRDARLRGEIDGKKVGKKVLYSAEVLRNYLRRLN